MKWDEFIGKFGFNDHRKRLISSLKSAIYEFVKAGCGELYVDGSFVTSKAYPNDYDCCWRTTGVNISSLDPVLLDFTSKRRAQKLKYSGEFFPLPEINDPNMMTFLDFFQFDKNDNPKGIIQLDLGSVL